MTTLTQIDDFLGRKRLAMVGVSRHPKDFSRSLFEELRRRGYDMVPVNPDVAEVEGQRCYARVGDIVPPVQGALLMTKPAVTEEVVRECQSAGIQAIWMYRATGKGSVNSSAAEFCSSHGMTLVAGECPFMFLPETAWIHRLHGLCRKLTGSYPAR
jgi:predicted CoA-binding protein